MAESKPVRQKGKKGILIAVICITLGALLAFAAYTVDQNNRIMENVNALAGVSVGGEDISGLSRDQALSATAGISDALLSKVQVSVDVAGEVYEYNARDLFIVTDYEAAVERALSHGHTGTLEERRQAIKDTEEQGADFPVTVHADREKILSVLLPLKAALDQAPVNASYVFTPWGHLPDGTPYGQDVEAMIKSSAAGEDVKRPELARISASDMPNKLRYLFWKNDKYVQDYIPKDADIARFVYTEGIPGRSVDMEAVADAIATAVETGDYRTIAAPVTPIAPDITVEELKQETQLVSSWTSSYSLHYGYNRNWNVAKLSGIINGVVIAPGQEWSINEQAGPRSLATGWKEAAGISNGGYTQQAGGGVCQLSSTVYNAAIRTALEITDSTHHSISSDYIPLGLDATISTGAPDLKIKNPYDVPVYLVSYTNPKDKNVTVEIYGKPVVDAELGPVILDFSFKDLGRFGSPSMNYYYNTAVAPDETAIAPGQSYEFAKARPGREVQTYIHYLSPEGGEIKAADFHHYKWNPINGRTYVNGPDPSLATIPMLTPEQMAAGQ
ncbi:MAG TPA: VanW family protein [Feifaniaceae bacterium]|nr:VanW family protein [Feifaniaceae bacterium]